MNDFDYFQKEWAKQNEKLGIKQVTIADVYEDIIKHRAGNYLVPIRTPLRSLANNFNFGKGRLTLWTGYPQSGKSEILRFLGFHYGLSQKCKVGIFTPESDTVIFLDELSIMAADFMSKSDDYLSENWTVLDIQDGMPSIDDILNIMEDLVVKGHGFFIIDPMNWITSSNYTSSAFESLRLSLTQLKQFAKRTNTCVNYVEHPKTPQANRNGEYPRANTFMVNGGVMHWNKVDAVVIIHRIRNVGEYGAISGREDKVEFEVAKQKVQRIYGYPGTVPIRYKAETFSYYDDDIVSRDFTISLPAKKADDNEPF